VLNALDKDDLDSRWAPHIPPTASARVLAVCGEVERASQWQRLNPPARTWDGDCRVPLPSLSVGG
jgi:hypothetical protein